MTGQKEFLNLFGSITMLQVVELLLAGVFLFLVYKKVKDYLIKKHDREKLHNEQLQEALTAVRKYPEYRQQSLDIQEKLTKSLTDLQDAQRDTVKRLDKIEETSKRRERNKLREKLIQSFKFYTNLESNPSQSWTRMESEAFWELFRDYEDADGNGYIHTEVQPAMMGLKVVDVKKNK